MCENGKKLIEITSLECLLLTHCILVNSSTAICGISQFVIFRVVRLLLFSICDGKPCWQNSVDPDQTPHYVASDLGLHCLPVTLLRVSRKQQVNS